MKCIYAISSDVSETGCRLAGQYTEALSKLSDDAISLGDSLRAFAELHAVAVVKVDDEDWARVIVTFGTQAERELAGELFLSSNDAMSIKSALAGSRRLVGGLNLSAWFGNHAGHGCSFVMVSE